MAVVGRRFFSLRKKIDHFEIDFESRTVDFLSWLILKRIFLNFQVKNHLPLPVEVYYQIDTNLESCGVVDADGEINLPLQSVYTPTGDLFFRPVDDQ